MTPPPAVRTEDARSGLKAGVIALWSFWALFSLVTPVTIFDANTYNLARVELAWRGGLFGNPCWNTDRQVCFPWSFDALHLPFLALGWGAALPSFACFTGVLLIVFRMVRDRVGRREAWWCCLALLSLPTLMYQATSTKNDIPVVFAVAAWAYALDRHRARGGRRYLLLMALALALAAGVKSSGVPLAFLLGLASLFFLRRTPRALGIFLAGSVAAAALWGSGEIYLNNLRRFGHALGPPGFVQVHVNRDGLAGAGANAVRYLAGNTSLGFDSIDPRSGFTLELEGGCRQVLRAVGWRDRGYAPGISDASLRFLNDGWEASSDYGPLGGMALWFALGAAAWWRPRDPAWRLLVLGLAALGLTCFTTAWMPWNERFLLLPVALAALALVLAVLRRRSLVLRGALLAVILFSGLVEPCYSLNKNPAGLWAALRDRREFTFRERPTMRAVVDDLADRARGGRLKRLAVCAGPDSWILPLFFIPGLKVDPVPDPTGLAAAAARPGEMALMLGRGASDSELAGLALVRTYPEPASALYRLKR